MTTPFMLRALGELLILAAICGPVGAFVLVRRLSFVADALTHTVFPGVVVGFIAGGIDGVFLGALVAGVLTALALTLLTRDGGLSSDAATAVLLTAMFAIGVVLVSRRSSFASDLTAFLFGRILTVTPRQLAETAVLGVAVLAMLALGGRQFLFRAFDPVGASAAGYRPARLDLWLNLIVALVVVAAVRAVGTVLVVALLVVPAAAARLVTARFLPLLLAATVLTAGAGWLGLWLSWTASVDHGLRLTSASAVVLLLVAAYVLLLPLRPLRAGLLGAGLLGAGLLGAGLLGAGSLRAWPLGAGSLRAGKLRAGKLRAGSLRHRDGRARPGHSPRRPS